MPRFCDCCGHRYEGGGLCQGPWWCKKSKFNQEVEQRLARHELRKARAAAVWWREVAEETAYQAAGQQQKTATAHRFERSDAPAAAAQDRAAAAGQQPAPDRAAAWQERSAGPPPAPAAAAAPARAAAAAAGHQQKPERAAVPPSAVVFIGNLPVLVDSESCKNIFSGYGRVLDCKVVGPEPENPSTKAWALVRFGSLEEAAWVVANLGGNVPERLADPIVALDAWAVRLMLDAFSY